MCRGGARPNFGSRYHLPYGGCHGSITSSSEAGSCKQTWPEYALITVGTRGRNGYPDPIVLARLRRAGANILRTDTRGTIAVIARHDGSVTVRRGRERCPRVPTMLGLGYYVQINAVAIQQSSRRLALGNA